MEWKSLVDGVAATAAIASGISGLAASITTITRRNRLLRQLDMLTQIHTRIPDSEKAAVEVMMREVVEALKRGGLNAGVRVFAGALPMATLAAASVATIVFIYAQKPSAAQVLVFALAVGGVLAGVLLVGHLVWIHVVEPLLARAFATAVAGKDVSFW